MATRKTATDSMCQRSLTLLHSEMASNKISDSLEKTTYIQYTENISNASCFYFQTEIHVCKRMSSCMFKIMAFSNMSFRDRNEYKLKRAKHNKNIIKFYFVLKFILRK